MAEESKTLLVVRAKDGTQVAYALADKPKVTFTLSDLVITTKGVEVNYSLDNMVSFTYEANETSYITNLQTDDTLFKLDGEYLLFPALKSNSTVSVFSIKGTIVFKRTLRENGEYAFPLSDLNAGVYIINVNGLSYKIMKK